MEIDNQIDALLRQFDLEEILDQMDLTEEDILKMLFEQGYELPETT